MEFLIVGLFFALIVVIIDNLSNKKKIKNMPINEQTEPTINVTENLPYKKKLLLTKNEWFFYKGLKPVADELGFTVLAKVRLADLVEVDVKDNKEFMKYFNKINKKHVDFILAKPENLQIVLLIELDDSSHNLKQKERDEFIEAVYNQTGYKLLRVKGAIDIKQRIENILELNPNSTIS